jgi:phosphatidylglycerophosphatase A
MKKPLIIFLATGAYVGYSPMAPGTVGTLWGVAINFLISNLKLPGRALVLGVGIALSIFLAGEARRIIGGRDPAPIVCDEIIGFCVAAFLLPFTLFNLILVFILFRFFDILKPFPGGFIDRNLKGGTGIVLDDVVAGLYANVTAHVIIRFVSG